MATNRPRAKSHSTVSSSGGIDLSSASPNSLIPPSIPELTEEKILEEVAPTSPHLIKVPHRKSLTKSKGGKLNSDDSSDSVDIGELPESEILEDDSLSLTPKEKFRLFGSPRKKQSPRQGSPRQGSSRGSSQSSSPRSVNNSPRLSPRIKTSSSNNGSPRIEIVDTEPLGELPISKLQAEKLIEEAQNKLVEMAKSKDDTKKKMNVAEGRYRKEFGINFVYEPDCDNFKKYDVVITGSDTQGLGSLFYLIDRSNKFGEGGYSTVCAAYNLQTGEKCAAKIYTKAVGFNMVLDEKNCLMGLKRFRGGINLDSLATGDRIIFMDYFPGKPLLQVLYRFELPNRDEGRFEIDYLEKIHLPYHVRLTIVIKILKAVADFQEAGFVNRDIKSDNFLCLIHPDDAIELNLIDMDTAFPKEKQVIQIASTFGYLAPEIQKQVPEPYSTASDLFSTGIVVWEVLTNVNFQKNLADKFESIVASDGRRHLSRGELSELLSDAAFDFSSKPLEAAIDGFVYQYFIKSQLMLLVAKLTLENPVERLKGTTLLGEIENVTQLKDKLESIFKSIKSFIHGIAGIQALGVPLKLCVEVVKNHAFLSQKSIRDMANVILDAQLDDALKLMGKPDDMIDNFQHQFTSLFEAIKFLIAGSSGLAHYDVSFRAVEPLIKRFTPRPKETADFFNFLAVQPLTLQNGKAIFEVSLKK